MVEDLEIIFKNGWRCPRSVAHPAFQRTQTQILFRENSFALNFSYIFSSVQSLSRVQLFATPWIAAYQASLSITNSWSLLKLMSMESVMPSSHLTLCHPLLLLPIYIKTDQI